MSVKTNLKFGFSIVELTRLALLFSVALVLMFVETIIPPIPAMPPGIKLGLSNIVVMYTLFFLGNKQAFILLVLKSFFVFLTRGIFAFSMSLAGGFFSIIIMILILSLKKVHITYIMTSVIASVAHNIGQLCMASIILANVQAFYYAPVLLLSGIFMGIITGTILKITLPAMKRLGLKNN